MVKNNEKLDPRTLATQNDQKEREQIVDESTEG